IGAKKVSPGRKAWEKSQEKRERRRCDTSVTGAAITPRTSNSTTKRMRLLESKTSPAAPSNNTQIHAPSSLSPKANFFHPESKVAPSNRAPAPNPTSEIVPTPSRSAEPPRPPRPRKRFFHTQSAAPPAPSPPPQDHTRERSPPPSTAR